MARHISIVVVGLIGTMLLTGCALHPARSDGIEFVIHVSVDGLSGPLLQDLLADAAGDFPSFKRLADEGATTFNARTDFTHTNAPPNHTSMLTGRPVLQPTGRPDSVHHGYTHNSGPAPTDTLHNQGNPAVEYVASAFDVAHDHGLSTALYASKSKFAIYPQSYDAEHGAPDLTRKSDGRAKIDTTVIMSPADMHAHFLAVMKAKPYRYSFVHYRNPDSAGHGHGWGRAKWAASVKTIDRYVGDLLRLAATDPRLAGRTALILSADHGGTGKGHGDAADAANYTIPFLVWGPGVAAGADLYALNASTRADPGTSRPDYDAAPQPIRNGDGGNLALRLLGLGPIPGSTINADQGLDVGP